MRRTVANELVRAVERTIVIERERTALGPGRDQLANLQSCRKSETKVSYTLGMWEYPKKEHHAS
jgi:hypothetical protein